MVYGSAYQSGFFVCASVLRCKQSEPGERHVRRTTNALMRAGQETDMSLVELEFARELHPVDVIEHVANSNEWSFERTGDDEIAISVAGSWTDYHISFSWMEDYEALHLACAFDIKVAEPRVNEVLRLLSLINEQLLMGHFDLWRQEGAIMYRQSLLLAGGAEPTSRQVEVLLSSAIEACETYFQAFQFVVWSGVTAREAMESVLFETVGQA
ncbi:YbjN domain-containing protein [Paenochrobactrum glaciei]